jgi:uncharacterized protein YfdQ (DUF2303 family)
MTTETETIARLARAGSAQVLKTSDGREFLVTPNETSHVEVSDPNGLKLTKPRYISQHVSLQTTDSLVEYVKRFKGKGTILLADVSTNSIMGAIDYHVTDHAEHVAHCAKLQLAYSTEWTEWNRISGKLMEQLEFARFVEENGADVRAPTGADLLECVRDLQAHRKVNFTKAVRTSSENENFEYSDETTASTKKGAIEVPTKFQLGIPIYFGESDVEVFAFLRWKLGDGNLTLGIALHRAEHVRQAVFKGIVASVAERAACLAVFGKI